MTVVCSATPEVKFIKCLYRRALTARTGCDFIPGVCVVREESYVEK
jgi:hypothetical protein